MDLSQLSAPTLCICTCNALLLTGLTIVCMHRSFPNIFVRVSTLCRRVLLARKPLAVCYTLQDTIRALEVPESVRAHVQKLVDHNVQDKTGCVVGAAMRTNVILKSVEGLGGIVDDDVLKLCAMVECWQAFLLVEDDIMDGGVTRRGKPCWHTMVTKEIAINDGLILCSLTYNILNSMRRSDTKKFAALCYIWHDVQMKTAVGQCVDMLPFDVRNSSAFDYEFMALHKTGLYTFFLPMCAAHILVHHALDDERYALYLRIGGILGLLYQMTDDYIDAFCQRPNKTARDVEEGKCTWCICTAMRMADEEQKAELTRHYGTEGGRLAVTNVFRVLKLDSKLHSEVLTLRERALSVCSGDKMMENIVVSVIDSIQSKIRRTTATTE